MKISLLSAKIRKKGRCESYKPKMSTWGKKKMKKEKGGAGRNKVGRGNKGSEAGEKGVG